MFPPRLICKVYMLGALKIISSKPQSLSSLMGRGHGAAVGNYSVYIIKFHTAWRLAPHSSAPHSNVIRLQYRLATAESHSSQQRKIRHIHGGEAVGIHSTPLPLSSIKINLVKGGPD